MTAPIFLFTDFSLKGPYVGQMKGAIHSVFSDASIIDLMHDAPAMNPRASAYLLAAAIRDLPTDATIIAVVDPGVGSDREALLIQADGRRLVGPDNGLLEIVRRQAETSETFVLNWRPKKLSASFHGRDLFAPAAANWAKGQQPVCTQIFTPTIIGQDWPDDLAEVIYIDGYDNAMTGVRAQTQPERITLTLPKGITIPQARTFSDCPTGTGFWYKNSLGLIEIAINGGSAAAIFDLKVGDLIQL
ncbi:MAG: SAM-dependent chlorinase/fluorinase [Alphaproteobacteria bacterium]|nr:SAM-dependent chlorinase/fluorinase [Alphaproteobacteria bacterium]